ncbi:MAG TPA: DUF2505 domain-containing protein [Myxococcota bacterium]|jgi:hypothetical protein|nr:DUF2505 domain-containing protein [Myxococcota bacterium]
MADVRCDHTFDCTPEVFWEIFFDDTIMDGIMAKVGVKERKLLQDETRGDVRHRRMREKPERDVPAPIKKVTGGDLTYTEIQRFYAKDSKLDFDIEPAVMKEKTKIAGTMRVVAEGAGRCRRIMNATVKVDIMLVGGMIADFIGAQIKDGYDKSVPPMREAIKAHLARKQPQQP